MLDDAHYGVHILRTMEPLPGYDAWLTTEPDLFDDAPEESDDEERRYDDWVDSEIDRRKEDAP